MPTVFLSYASQDEAYAKSLEQELTNHEITVWRDKTNLHAGERWPKRLGEAIADQIFFLLLWSHPAAQSDFVELEWNIAVAMKKTIMPCLVDGTPLPHVLKTSHGIPVKDPSQLVEHILMAIQKNPISPTLKTPQLLLSKLVEMPSAEPKEVLKYVQLMVNQSVESVQGNVTQVGRDLVCNIYQYRENSNHEEKQPLPDEVSKWKPIHTWVATLAGIFSILGVVSGVFKEPPATPRLDPVAISQTQSVEFHVIGYIKDRKKVPIPGVKVILTSLENPNLEKETITSENGRYQLTAAGIEGQNVRVVATKGCYRTGDKNTWLGNPGNDFILEKEPQCEK